MRKEGKHQDEMNGPDFEMVFSLGKMYIFGNIHDSLYPLKLGTPYMTIEEIPSGNGSKTIIGSVMAPSVKHDPSEGQLPPVSQERKDLFANCRKDLLTRQLANSENLDKSILSLSTASLGFSLAFIKEIVSVNQAINVYLLQLSWLCFVCAIVSTMASFVVSQRGINKQLFFAEQYYLMQKDEYLDKTNWLSKVNDWLNAFSFTLFTCGIILTVIFVWTNL